MRSDDSGRYSFRSGEEPVNHAAQTLPKRKKITQAGIILLLCAAGLIWFLWWRSNQADQVLAEASLEQLQQIATENPQNARALYYLGMQLGRRGQKEESANALRRAAELKPDDEEIWSAAAGATNAQQGPEAAFQVMNEFLKRHPDSVKMKEQRASLLASLQRASDGFAAAKRYEEAILYYRMWLKEDPASEPAQQGLHRALQEGGRKTAGARDAFLTLAEVYEMQGHTLKADEARKQAEQIATETLKAPPKTNDSAINP